MAYDPFYSTNPAVSAMEAHRGRIEQVRENSARLAQSYATYATTGDGEFLIELPNLFGCTFTERPVVAYSYALQADEIIAGSMPQSTGGIREWVQDARGFYTGAYVFFVINTGTSLSTTNPEVNPDSATTPATGTGTVFSDSFGRADSSLIGNGWVQAGGDFFIDTQRAITRDASSFMGQGFGHKDMTVSSDLRAPGEGSPCVYAWSSSVAGGTLGYCLAFNATATGTNLELRKSGSPVASKHFGTAGAAIGNTNLVLKLKVVGTSVEGYVNNSLQLTYTDDGTQPTGSWSGVGNQGLASADGIAIDNVIMGEVIGSTEAAPSAPVDVPGTPLYTINHDFTFTGVALKDLPDYLLDIGGAQVIPIPPP